MVTPPPQKAWICRLDGGVCDLLQPTVCSLYSGVDAIGLGPAALHPPPPATNRATKSVNVRKHSSWTTALHLPSHPFIANLVKVVATTTAPIQKGENQSLGRFVCGTQTAPDIAASLPKPLKAWATNTLLLEPTRVVRTPTQQGFKKKKTTPRSVSYPLVSVSLRTYLGRRYVVSQRFRRPPPPKINTRLSPGSKTHVATAERRHSSALT